MHVHTVYAVNFFKRMPTSRGTVEDRSGLHPHGQRARDHSKMEVCALAEILLGGTVGSGSLNHYIGPSDFCGHAGTKKIVHIKYTTQLQRLT